MTYYLGQITNEHVVVYVREIVKQLSLGHGQGYLKCSCRGKCRNRCSCKAAGLACSSKCHEKNPTHPCENKEDTAATQTVSASTSTACSSTNETTTAKKIVLRKRVNKN